MKRLLLAAACVAALAGCARQELYGQLSEHQANEMVALLRNAGVAVDKSAQENNRWAIGVPNADFSRAVGLLHASGYPRADFDTLGQVFKKEGFVSSPLEERARLIHALSQEMAHTLNQIDGVIVARVHLAVPEKDPLADKPRPAAASVFIKHRPGVDLSSRVGQIRALAVNSIEGLPYDNVTVVLFPAEPWPEALPAAASPVGAIDTPLLASASLGGAALLVGAATWWWQRRRPAARAVVAQRAEAERAD